jgi:hypothetical protein
MQLTENCVEVRMHTMMRCSATLYHAPERHADLHEHTPHSLTNYA